MISKKLDRYLTAAVLKVSLAGQLGFLGVFIFIDLFDKAFKLKAPDGMSQFSFLAQYYLAECPEIVHTTSPFIYSLACLITLAKFQHNSQIVAINAAGLSIHRVLRPYFLLSMCLGLLIFLSQNIAMPILSHWKSTHLSQYLPKEASKPLGFRDRVHLPQHSAFQGLPQEQSLSIIDIDKIEPKEKTGEGFHITFMDVSERPIAKCYGEHFSWNDKDEIVLEKIFFLPYQDEPRLKPMTKVSIHIDIPLDKVVLAAKNIQALPLWDLQHFNTNAEILAERYYRVSNTAMPTLMLLVSSVLALPLIFKKPIYSYFASLGASFGVFFLISYLKADIASGNMGTGLALSLSIALPLIIYLSKRHTIPS